MPAAGQSPALSLMEVSPREIHSACSSHWLYEICHRNSFHLPNAYIFFLFLTNEHTQRGLSYEGSKMGGTVNLCKSLFGAGVLVRKCASDHQHLYPPVFLFFSLKRFPSPSSLTFSNLQAMPHAFTQTGVVLGTVLYVVIGLIVVVRAYFRIRWRCTRCGRDGWLAGSM